MRRLLAWATSVGLGLSIAAVGLLFLGPAFGFHAWPGHGSPPRAGVSELPAAPLIAAVASKSGRGATSLGARLGRLPATGTAVASTGFSLVGSGPSAVVRGQGTPVRLPAASSPATGNGAPAPAAPVVATPVAPVVTPTPAAPVVAVAPVAAPIATPVAATATQQPAAASITPSSVTQNTAAEQDNRGRGHDHGTRQNQGRDDHGSNVQQVAKVATPVVATTVHATRKGHNDVAGTANVPVVTPPAAPTPVIDKQAGHGDQSPPNTGVDPSQGHGRHDDNGSSGDGSDQGHGGGDAGGHGHGH